MRPQLRRLLIPGLILCLLAQGQAFACTLWAAIGSAVSGGGLLIAKNRDWAPDNVQVVKTVQPKSGWRYIGLFAEDNDEPGMKAGLNEKGLVWVCASPSSLPKAQRRDQPGQHGLGGEILNRFASVDELLANQSILAKGRAMFYLVADARQVALIEIGLGGKYSIQTFENGVAAHTNHYLSPELAHLNQKIGKSSAARLGRVTALLRESPVCTLGRFLQISDDRRDGPNNSLWRLGSKADSERTLAAWIVQIVPGASPNLHVKLANPGAAVQEFDFVADAPLFDKPLAVGR